MRLARSERVGPATYRRLLQRYGTAASAIDALPALARNGGAAAPKLLARDLAAREFERAERAAARLIFLDEPAYPKLLALLHDAPPVIAVLGDPAHLALPAVAIVGSRNASANGRAIAEQLAEELAAQGLAVVSGLARGIDAAAHGGALRRGVTLAVVAGGLDKPYPPEHADLQAEIARAGAVLSEAPFGTAPQARHFPRRNRIVAGLALGVVVIEAAQRSGSLITARLALEAGRELFAVPGSPLDPRCHGSNDLIRQGAHLTETAADITANLPPHPSRVGVQRLALFDRPGLEEPEADPYDPGPDGAANVNQREMDELRDQLEVMLSPSPTSVDDLIARCQVSPAAVNGVLLELELAGRVQFLPGQRVILIGQGLDESGAARFPQDWGDTD